MKTIKNLIIASIMAVVLLSSAPASALAWGIGIGGAGNAPAKQERLKHASNNIKTASENKARAKAKREESKQKVLNNVAQRHANRLARRFEHYNTRLTAISAKLDERITKLADEGKNMVAAKAKLTEALSKLEEANKLGSEAVSDFRSIKPGPFPQQKEQAFAARDKAKIARQAYKDTLILLKESLKLAKDSIRAGEQDAD